MYPNQEQKEKLKKAFGVTRWTYNQALAKIKNSECKVSLKDLRSKCVNNYNFEDKPWVLEVPYDIRDEAVRDLYKSYLINFKSDKKFYKKFRSKKDQCKSIVIHKKHWIHIKGWYGSLFRNMKTKEKLPKTLLGDTRLVMTNLNEFYLMTYVPFILNENQSFKRNDVVSLDPGIRSFQTCYNPSGFMTEWGRGDMKELIRISLVQDKLKSKCTKVNHKKRYKLGVAIKRIAKKIKNKVDDIHRKCIKWLVTSHSVVLIPAFGVRSIAQSKLAKVSKRGIYIWSHFLFRQRLLSKAKQYPCNVIEVTEEYTSKTCSNCGFLNGKNTTKMFSCKECNYSIDRDYNGSRNIMLKYLTEQRKLH